MMTTREKAALLVASAATAATAATVATVAGFILGPPCAIPVALTYLGLVMALVRPERAGWADPKTFDAVAARIVAHDLGLPWIEANGTMSWPSEPRTVARKAMLAEVAQSGVRVSDLLASVEERFAEMAASSEARYGHTAPSCIDCRDSGVLVDGYGATPSGKAIRYVTPCPCKTGQSL
jgi:hypothetical protein